MRRAIWHGTMTVLNTKLEPEWLPEGLTSVDFSDCFVTCFIPELHCTSRSANYCRRWVQARGYSLVVWQTAAVSFSRLIITVCNNFHRYVQATASGWPLLTICVQLTLVETVVRLIFGKLFTDMRRLNCLLQTWWDSEHKTVLYYKYTNERTV